MTKPLHPTAESIKAGQTIYMVCATPDQRCSLYYFVHAITITGKSSMRPKEGEVMEFAPVDWIKAKMTKPGYSNNLFYLLKNDFFYSKRKAISRMKELQRWERKWN
jgi:hypothetical protein